MIAILVPVLDRPHRAAPLVESVEAATSVPHRLVFLCTPGDDAEIEAVRATGAEYDIVPWTPERGDYAKKINYGIETTSEEWVLQAADDLLFHPGWDEEVLRTAELRPAARVIGTNDLGNPLVKAGRHSTHSLIRREYVEEHGTIDEPGKAMHEGYWHCWVDNELIATAVARRCYFASRRSRVEHLHPIWRDRHQPGGRKGVDDATYRRGQQRYHEDHELFLERRRLWR